MARTTSDLGSILLATKTKLTTTDGVLPSHLVFLGLEPDNLAPPMRSDTYAIITPGTQKANMGYTAGGGRHLLVYEAELTVTVYCRLDLDESGSEDSYLTDATLGVLSTVNAVVDSLDVFDPVDADGGGMLAEPMKVLAVDVPKKVATPGWGRVPIRLSFAYQYGLTPPLF